MPRFLTIDTRYSSPTNSFWDHTSIFTTYCTILWYFQSQSPYYNTTQSSPAPALPPSTSTSTSYFQPIPKPPCNNSTTRLLSLSLFLSLRPHFPPTLNLTRCDFISDRFCADFLSLSHPTLTLVLVAQAGPLPFARSSHISDSAATPWPSTSNILDNPPILPSRSLNPTSHIYYTTRGD